MVFETVRHARRRILVNEAVRHAAYAVSAALASLILLLLLGTQILSWRWLFLLPAITLAVGTYLAWRSAPSAYQVAQRVDHNLKLADTISTALFFAAGQKRAIPFEPRDEMRRGQWSQAEQVACRRGSPAGHPHTDAARAVWDGTAGTVSRQPVRVALRFGSPAGPARTAGPNRTGQAGVHGSAPTGPRSEEDRCA